MIDHRYILAENLKMIRRRLDLTQKELAAKLDVTQAAVGSYEERRAMPAIEVMLRISELSGYTVEQLVSNPQTITPEEQKVIKWETLKKHFRLYVEGNKVLSEDMAFEWFKMNLL
jgi:transcriptional regulator with XRE-family HTH domain